MSYTAQNIDIEALKKQIDQFADYASRLESDDATINLFKLQTDISRSLAQNIQVTTEEIQKFNQYLNNITERGSTTSGNATSEETLVKNIFEKLYSVNKQVEQIQLQIKNKLEASGHNLSATDTFEIQYLVTQMTVLMDLASKMGGKASDAFQVLFRNQ